MEAGTRREAVRNPMASATSESHGCLRRQRCDVAHLAAGANLRLAVNMESAAARREVEPAFRLVADDVLHHGIGMPRGIAERPTRDRSDVLLELADGTGLDRPVP